MENKNETVIDLREFVKSSEIGYIEAKSSHLKKYELNSMIYIKHSVNKLEEYIFEDVLTNGLQTVGWTYRPSNEKNPSILVIWND